MFIHQHRRAVIAVFIALFAAAAFFSTRLTFVYDFERFFPQDDDAIDVYEAFTETFGQDDNFLFVGLETADGGPILTPERMRRVDSIGVALRRLDGVVEAQSLPGLQSFVISPVGIVAKFPLLHLDDEGRFRSDSARLVSDATIFGNRLLSDDGRSTAIYLRTDTNDFRANRVMMEEVHAVLGAGWDGDYHLLGKANFETVLVDLQIREFIISSVVSIVMVLAAFLLFFRSWRSTLVALVSMVFCLVFFTGFMGLFRIPIDFISALYPVIIVIVGISDVVHIASRYILEVRSGVGRGRAMSNTFRTIGAATFLTSVTTSIGFLSLLSSKLVPIRVFGAASAAGILLAFLIVILFTTAVLSYLPDKALKEIEFGRSVFSRFLERVHRFTRLRPGVVGVGFALVLVGCVHGISQISTDVEIGATLPRGEAVTADYYYFEDQFVGFRPYELLIDCPDGCDTYEAIRGIDRIDAYIDSVPALTRSFSLADVYRTLNRASRGDRRDAYTVPASESAFRRLARYTGYIPPNYSGTMLSPDGTTTRISATIKDIGTDSIQVINRDLRAFLDAEVDPGVLSARITGTGVLFDKNNEYLRASLLYGLGLAVLLIGVLMGGLFKDPRFLLISIIPNLVPLVFGAAVMGWLGIQLEASTSMIFAISYGIAVDDTIHYLSKLKLEWQKGTDLDEALRRTTIQAGRPIIVTSLILFFGFLVLLFSKTPAVFYVGVLISITLFTAVIADLLLIPVICRLVLKR